MIYKLVVQLAASHNFSLRFVKVDDAYNENVFYVGLDTCTGSEFTFKMGKKSYTFTKELWNKLFQLSSNDNDHKVTDEVGLKNFHVKKYCRSIRQILVNKGQCV